MADLLVDPGEQLLRPWGTSREIVATRPPEPEPGAREGREDQGGPEASFSFYSKRLKFTVNCMRQLDYWRRQRAARSPVEVAPGCEADEVLNQLR